MLNEKQRKALSHISPRDAFEYFSGYTDMLNDLPAIYRSWEGFHVVGQRVNILCKTLDEAVEEYKRHFNDTIKA